jgi:hypothetical protein
LFNLRELAISNEVLCPAAQVSQEDLQQAMPGRGKAETKAGARGAGHCGGRSQFSLAAAVAAKRRHA